MESFRGTFTNKVDAKGRVSVPAKFRAVVAAQGFNGITCFPSFLGKFLEAGGPAFTSEIDAILNKLPPFSPERDQLAAILVGNAMDLMFDGDGRVMLPREFMEHAGITDQITFVGMTTKFQIWSPAAYEAFRAEALKQASGHTGLLSDAFSALTGGRSVPAGSGQSGGGQ
ncbi:division/cell wall cluster transcriptional repressor MraZ [Tepidicaulis sp. LMO-SS28]|uniref:division/cell wall cluster transcriptional repressor MraZ n=1 Tax=Tepidicaulis sp. LMO-SS28 TaxID=3447455 RepID=UPI003EE2490C